MGWDARLRFNASTPPAAGLARMARVVAGRRVRVVAVRRLSGGVDASTHAVRFDPGGWVVLKRSWTPDPDSLTREFARLTFAERAAVPTPRPIAVDAGGEWFGRPALVMSRLPGRARLYDDAGAWIDDLAEALVAIHAVQLPQPLPGVLRAPHAGLVWRPPEAGKPRLSALVGRLLDVALALQDDLRRRSPVGVLLHHDFHHGNVVWYRARLSGVLDWNEARVGPAASDVAYCSVDLAMTHGKRAADRFCGAYRQRAGEVEDLRRWQALWVANDMRWVGYWVAGFHAAGLGHLTLPLLRRRLRAFARHVLADL